MPLLYQNRCKITHFFTNTKIFLLFVTFMLQFAAFCALGLHHAAHSACWHSRSRSILLDVCDDALGSEEHTCNAGSVLQCHAGHLGDPRGIGERCQHCRYVPHYRVRHHRHQGGYSCSCYASRRNGRHDVIPMHKMQQIAT